MQLVPGDNVPTRDEAGGNGYNEIVEDEMRKHKLGSKNFDIKLSTIRPGTSLLAALQYANPKCSLHAKLESSASTPNALCLLGGAARNILRQWNTDPRRRPQLDADLASIFVIATKRGHKTTYTTSNMYIHKMFSEHPGDRHIKYMNGRFVTVPPKFYLGYGIFARPDQTAFNVVTVLPCESCICVTASGRHFVYDWQTRRGQYTTLDPYYCYGNIIDDFGNLYPGDPIYIYDPVPQLLHITAHEAAYDVFKDAYEAQTDPDTAAEHASTSAAYASRAAAAAALMY